MFDRLFTDHPRAVGETYGEHFHAASTVGWTMLKGALGCFVHAAIPGLCVTTGSATIRKLHARVAPRADRATTAFDGIEANSF